MTQSYDKQTFKRRTVHSQSNTKTLEKRLITQRLQTDLKKVSLSNNQ